MKKLFLLFLATLLLVSCLTGCNSNTTTADGSSRDGVICGSVLFDHDKTPLADATVSIPKYNLITKTNDKGEFEFKKVLVNNQDINLEVSYRENFEKKTITQKLTSSDKVLNLSGISLKKLYGTFAGTIKVIFPSSMTSVTILLTDGQKIFHHKTQFIDFSTINFRVEKLPFNRKLYLNIDIEDPGQLPITNKYELFLTNDKLDQYYEYKMVGIM